MTAATATEPGGADDLYPDSKAPDFHSADFHGADSTTDDVHTVGSGAAGSHAAGSSTANSRPGNPALRLSGRELQIVRLVADGWPNKAIAAELSLSPLTVKNHLARIGRKLGACNRAHIVAIACRGGVIPGVPASPEFIDPAAI